MESGERSRVLKSVKGNPKSFCKPLYRTKAGRMYCGKAEEVLAGQALTRLRGKVQMIFTSPPFPLNRKKKYGNYEGDSYIQWLAALAPVLGDLLTPDGSIVIELGNAWEKGGPTMSTLPLRTLLEFQERGKFYLCQEFICFNPARLPSPAQWVNVERCRVKDSFTRVWWMSAVRKPKADNRKILTEYSSSMKRLLARGTYNSGVRPSEHNIGETSFLSDNKGAIPPNVLVPPADNWLADLTEVLPIANTATNDAYQEFCRKERIQGHPARMPMKLVEFFLRFLTDEKDVVLDPFAGSNTTGFVAEQLRRRWVSIEANPEYARLSSVRFAHHKKC